MQDLIDKIEELRKNLAAMKKPKEGPLVPAIKQPSIKPLSMPAAGTGGAPKKIPGVAPPSNKDPRQVAAQLKNPRPKKPKIEMLKFEKNGQWSLSKFGENNSV